MKKHLCTLAAATLLTVTLGGSNALAAVLFGENEKNYAGSSCQPATSVDSDRVRYLIGTARNTSTSAALFLECPIIKDEYSSKVNSGLVVVVDRRTDDLIQFPCCPSSLQEFTK